MLLIPAVDFLIGGNERGANDQSGCDNEAISRISMEIRQTATFHCDGGRKWFERNRRFEVSLDPVIHGRAEEYTPFACEHGYFP